MSLASYFQTTDTEVDVFKTYYTKSTDGCYSKIITLSDKTTLNPSSEGWYERQDVHNAKYRVRVDDYQIIYLGNLCQQLVNKLGSFPKTALDRTRTVSGTTVSWHTLFHDTVWDETLGKCNLPENAVTYTANMFFAEHINELIHLLESNADKQLTSDWSTFSSLLSSFNTVITSASASGKFKEDGGYQFEASTLGTSGRTEDTYTLAYKWTCIDYQLCQYVLSAALTRAQTHSTSSATIISKIIDYLRRCAVTMIELAKNADSVVIVDRTQVSA